LQLGPKQTMIAVIVSQKIITAFCDVNSELTHFQIPIPALGYMARFQVKKPVIKWCKTLTSHVIDHYKNYTDITVQQCLLTTRY
jgi:hypothetical protein